MTSLREQLLAAPPEVRARLRAEAVAAAAPRSFSFKRGLQDVTIGGLRVADGHLVFHLSVSLGGKVLWADEVHVVNPPILVRSGGTDDAPTYTENPVAALREVILDLIREQVG